MTLLIEYIMSFLIIMLIISNTINVLSLLIYCLLSRLRIYTLINLFIGIYLSFVIIKIPREFIYDNKLWFILVFFTTKELLIKLVEYQRNYFLSL